MLGYVRVHAVSSPGWIPGQTEQQIGASWIGSAEELNPGLE